MIFDLLDYIAGFIKMILYKIFWVRRLKYSVRSKFSSKSSIRLFNKSKLIMGKNVGIRAGTIIRANFDGEIILHDNVGINNYCLINCMSKIEIGENTIIGQGVKFYDHNHVFNTAQIVRNAGFSMEPIVIGSNTWIGSDCVILKGVKIGNNCVIGAGTIVQNDVPDNTMVYADRTLQTQQIDRNKDND